MKQRLLTYAFLLAALASAARAQTAEVTIQLNEQFFDALLDAVFKNAGPLEYPIAAAETRRPAVRNSNAARFASAFAAEPIRNKKSALENCKETIRLQREIDGVQTAVRFRDGRIYAPIAFAGSYNPPLIGCVDFAGVAETNIELEFDAARRALVGRARVLNVNLSGTGGVGGSLVARIVQNSIDRRINPIEILSTDKVSFIVPVQNAGSLKMRATGIRHEITPGALSVRISYEFQKAE